MYQKNSAIGVVICLVSFVLFGMFFAFLPLGFAFFPIFPGIFIFVIIITIASVSLQNSKVRQRSYFNRINNTQIPVKNPYIVQNAKIIEIQEDKQINQPQYCPYCGVRIDIDSMYCHTCGTKLQGE